MDVLASHRQDLILLAVTLDNLLPRDVTILVAHSCGYHSSQEYPLIVGKCLSGHMQAHQCLWHGKRHPNEHNLLAFEVGMSDLEMHKCWMSRNHGRYFNWELKRLRWEIVVTEIERANCGVPVHSVNDVASCLKVNLAVRKVKFSDLVWHDKISWQNSADMLVCITTRKIQTHEKSHAVKSLYDRHQMVCTCNRSHNVEVLEFVRS